MFDAFLIIPDFQRPAVEFSPQSRVPALTVFSQTHFSARTMYSMGSKAEAGEHTGAVFRVCTDLLAGEFQHR